MPDNYSISKIVAEEIKDSRGNPTIKVTVWVGNNSASFSVPSGASTGIHEAHELRDQDGKGVKDSMEKVNNIIAKALIGKDVLNQKEIDRIMIDLDGTPNKDNLGGNSMIGVSLACAKAAAKVNNQEVYEYLRTLMEIKPSRKVPFLFINLLEGGKHTKNNHLAFQEYMVVPDTEDVAEAIEIGIKIQNSVREILEKELGKGSVLLGDEGGFSPQTDDIKKPLYFLTEAVKKNNLQNKIKLALDTAASSFYSENMYKVNEKNISKEELMNIYESLTKEFDLISIEDPFDEEDFEDFTRLHQGFGETGKVLVVGDDLTVSNVALLKKAIEDKSINAMIIKPNQIGTLTETLETMKLARENDIKIIVSHRSGETDDDFIADLAYAFGCFGFKSGAPVQSERMIKYQRLINISHRLGGVKK